MWIRRRLLTLALTVPALAAIPAQAAECEFILGFAALKALIDEAEGPEKVGACLENQRFNPANGDALQQTTGGLMVWRKADNWTAFTDGYRTWLNGPHGLQARLNTEQFDWEGALDTPPSAPITVSTPTPEPTTAPLADLGDWKMSKWTDALTKGTRHRAHLSADTWQGDLEGAPVLAMRCVQGEQGLDDVYVSWKTFIGKGIDNLLPIRYRFDEEEIVDTEWHSSTDSRSTFVKFDRDRVAVHFLSDLLYGEYSEIAIEVSFFGKTATGVWQPHGAQAAHREMLRRCKGL